MRRDPQNIKSIRIFFNLSLTTEVLVTRFSWRHPKKVIFLIENKYESLISTSWISVNTSCTDTFAFHTSTWISNHGKGKIYVYKSSYLKKELKKHQWDWIASGNLFEIFLLLWHKVCEWDPIIICFSWEPLWSFNYDHFNNFTSCLPQNTRTV